MQQSFTVLEFDGSTEALANLLARGMAKVRCDRNAHGGIDVFYDVTEELPERELNHPHSKDLDKEPPTREGIKERMARLVQEQQTKLEQQKNPAPPRRRSDLEH